MFYLPGKARNLLIPLCLLGCALCWEGQGFASQPQSGQMDTVPIFKLNAKKQSEAPKPDEPGVVGLDLLIFPSDYPLVQGVFPETSAEREGILPGDRLVQINGHSTLEKSRSQVDEMIPDKIGERVRLLISRNQQLKPVTLTVLPRSVPW